MSPPYLITSFLRRLSVELLEIAAFSQLVPLIILEITLGYALFVNAAGLLGKNYSYPLAMIHGVMVRLPPVWLVIVATIIAYSLLRLPRLFIAKEDRWSIRRKASLTLTFIIIGYMVLFGLLFLGNQQMIPTVWVVLLAITVGATLYGFGVRHFINMFIRRLEQEELYQTVDSNHPEFSQK
jgi:hypothetical protein